MAYQHDFTLYEICGINSNDQMDLLQGLWNYVMDFILFCYAAGRLYGCSALVPACCTYNRSIVLQSSNVSGTRFDEMLIADNATSRW